MKKQRTEVSIDEALLLTAFEAYGDSKEAYDSLPRESELSYAYLISDFFTYRRNLYDEVTNTLDDLIEDLVYEELDLTNSEVQSIHISPEKIEESINANIANELLRQVALNIMKIDCDPGPLLKSHFIALKRGGVSHENQIIQ